MLLAVARKFSEFRNSEIQKLFTWPMQPLIEVNSLKNDRKGQSAAML